MAFKPQSEDHEAMSEINVTPLVDVMLVLVIILLVTAPLVTQSVNVSLPKTAEVAAPVKDQPLQLNIDAQQKITLNKVDISDLASLEASLQKTLANQADVAVHLYVDQQVEYKKVAEVMAAVQHAGITKLSFVTVEQ
jgi:biopolymer transport protein TolR